MLINRISTRRKEISPAAADIAWSGQPTAKARRALSKEVKVEMHTKRHEDKNDVTIIEYVKPSSQMKAIPDHPALALVSLKEMYTHKLLHVMFDSFTFSKLRTLKLADSGAARYVVSGSIAGSGTSFFVKVLIQTSGENLDEVRKEIEKHIKTDFLVHVTAETKEGGPLDKYKKSVVDFLTSPADGFGEEYGHFAAVLSEPLPDGRTVG